MNQLERIILEVITASRDGATLSDIMERLSEERVTISRRSVQYRLADLMKQKQIIDGGKGRGKRYYRGDEGSPVNVSSILLTEQAQKAYDYIQQPLIQRKPIGYNDAFLDAYIPNKTSYLTVQDKAHLNQINTHDTQIKDADTYAKNILDRLIIDLSWNSSRLEGNTYSLLDTRRLIEFGQEAASGNRLEAQMILNHKEAIAFLVRGDNDIGVNSYTILNLHAILAQNLLADSTAAGRLRHIPIGIEKSCFLPLETPQRITQCFAIILEKAQAIQDPFEQAFFLMVHLPYLQPFDDVNKRVSRLAANIPFIKHHISPLSFTDVPQNIYITAILAVYELNDIHLLKDLFLWAYERSAQRYAAIQQSIGIPDPFRMKYHTQIRDNIHHIIASALNRSEAIVCIQDWAEKHIPTQDRANYQQLLEDELLSLHEGNFARYHIRPSEFKEWQAVWYKNNVHFAHH